MAQRRPDRDVRRPRRRRSGVASARRQRLRLRPDVRPGRLRANLRRARPRAEAQHQPPRRRIPQAGAGAERMTGEPLALYVHWPFCVSKCPYCDFNSHVRASIDQEVWRDALLADLEHEAQLLPGRTLTSIFFGGGTPSLMDPATVDAIIDAAHQHWPAAKGIEITLEANPNSVEAARFADLRAAGVNRLSLGLQSFDDAALAFLGRAH